MDDVIRMEDGTCVYSPYNPANIVITRLDVERLLVRYGLPAWIDNMALYSRAFVHPSYTKRYDMVTVERPPDCIELKSKSNQRLEFLGDGILECVTKFHLYRRFPKEDEGFMTDKKIAVVKNEEIGRMAYEMGLHTWLLLSKSNEEKKNRTHFKRLGCLFESFLGAIFLDFSKHPAATATTTTTNTMYITPGCQGNGYGFQMAQTFLENVFQQHVDWVSIIHTDDNYKNLLQVRLQREFKITPTYIDMNTTPSTSTITSTSTSTITSTITNSESPTTYHMSVYLCAGSELHSMHHQAVLSQEKVHIHRSICDHIARSSISLEEFETYQEIRDYIASHGNMYVFLGHAEHKIKKKAEQLAAQRALDSLNELV